MISIYEAVHKFINNVRFNYGDCHSDYLRVEYNEKYQVLKYKNSILLLKFNGILYWNRWFYSQDKGARKCTITVNTCLNDHGNSHAVIYKEDGMVEFIEEINAKCSFCSIDREKTKTLIKIQRGYICDECVKLSVPIIQNYTQKEYRQNVQELNFRL